MNIFENYSQKVKEAIHHDHLNRSTQKNFSFTGDSNTLLKAKASMPLTSKQLISKPELSLLSLKHVIKEYDYSDARVGLHPDFLHLVGTDLVEYHYINNLFIDIKGSTKLHDDYELDTVSNITNIIQTAAIHVCLLFGGHIQRLQGDGVFAYFGGKKMDKQEAVKNAVTAASMFTYFVENDLRKIFLEDGVEDIYTRIGIDFGDDDDVLWKNFGVGNCCELTTCSLSSSNSHKMQAHATRNGIVVGQNVKDKLQFDEKYFDYVRNSKGEITQRYIYEGRKKKIYYTQYKFEWLDFLKNLSYIRTDKNENLYVISEEEMESERIAKLRSAALLINTGAAFTDTKGNISSVNTGIKNQEHRFHYE